MTSVKISEIIEYLLGLGPMYNSPDFREVLALNDLNSFVIPFSSILKKALSEFEIKYPLFMMDRKFAIPTADTMTPFSDNYNAFLAGNIGIDQLELIPTSIVHFSLGLLSHYREFTYTVPYIRSNKAGVAKISYFTRYPIVLKAAKYNDRDEFTADSHIFGISPIMGVDWTYFMYQVEFHMLKYLADQKAQMSYTDLPIEFYQNLDNRISELENYISDWYQNPIWYGKLYI